MLHTSAHLRRTEQSGQVSFGLMSLQCKWFLVKPLVTFKSFTINEWFWQKMVLVHYKLELCSYRRIQSCRNQCDFTFMLRHKNTIYLLQQHGLGLKYCRFLTDLEMCIHPPHPPKKPQNIYTMNPIKLPSRIYSSLMPSKISWIQTRVNEWVSEWLRNAPCLSVDHVCLHI